MDSLRRARAASQRRLRQGQGRLRVRVAVASVAVTVGAVQRLAVWAGAPRMTSLPLLLRERARQFRAFYWPRRGRRGARSDSGNTRVEQSRVGSMGKGVEAQLSKGTCTSAARRELPHLIPAQPHEIDDSGRRVGTQSAEVWALPASGDAADERCPCGRGGRPSCHVSIGVRAC